MNPAGETNLSRELVSDKARVYRFSVIIEKDKDGYFAFSPELQGCYSQGDTYEETLENIRDAIRPPCRRSTGKRRRSPSA